MPRKKLEFKAGVRDQLRAIDRNWALKILQAIDLYSTEAEGDVKRLQNSNPPELRLRVGDYRVRMQEGT